MRVLFYLASTQLKQAGKDGVVSVKNDNVKMIFRNVLVILFDF